MVDRVELYLDGTFVRRENNAPYEWGTASSSSDPVVARWSSHTSSAAAAEARASRSQARLPAPPALLVPSQRSRMSG